MFGKEFFVCYLMKISSDLMILATPLLLGRIGMKIKSVLTAAVYKKAFVLSNTVKSSVTIGEVVNLMSVDAQRIQDSMGFVFLMLTTPVLIIAACVVLYTVIGPPILAGAFVMLCLIPMTRIRAVRLKEVAILFKLGFFKTLMNVVWSMAGFLTTLATFATYVLLDRSNYLDTAKAFTLLSVFSVLRGPLYGLTNVFHALTQGWEGIDLTVGEGLLVAVVGPVGCGKSSLLSAMLGEMDKVQGEVTTRGRFAYVPQQAWIQNATVRDNILFGRPYNRSQYKQTVTACQLTHDFAIMPAGDMTEIGENGINLSGGQKQRVSVARAVYSDSDVYLLDDPLSAVDSHVGKAIFRQVIADTGILKGKTRVLVTHGVHWLPMVDDIIVMEDGKVSERGSYEELILHDGPFAQFLKTYLTVDNTDEEEDQERAGHITLAFVSFLAAQSVGVGYNFWLKVWSGDPKMLNASTSDLDALAAGNVFYLGTYGTMGIGQLLFLTVFYYLFWTRVVTAARVLHSRLADRLLRAPMAFFDTTPIGRILNRVSHDVEVVDDILPIAILSMTMVTLLVIIVQIPESIVVLLPVRFYVPTMRQLGRFESVTRSPIFALFRETLTGAPSIRAYGAKDRFLEETMLLVDRNIAYSFASQALVSCCCNNDNYYYYYYYYYCCSCCCSNDKYYYYYYYYCCSCCCNNDKYYYYYYYYYYCSCCCSNDKYYYYYYFYYCSCCNHYKYHYYNYYYYYCYYYYNYVY
nr:hypothetical protein BaRGS_020006 [Batillaria attramentaria]